MYVKFCFEHFSDMEPGYTREYSTSSPYDSQVISDMQYAECWFEDLLPEMRMDLFYRSMPTLKTLDIGAF